MGMAHLHFGKGTRFSGSFMRIVAHLGNRQGSASRLQSSIAYELVASIEAIGDRGQREVTCRAVPCPYLKDKGIGLSKAVKTVALCARLRAWSWGMRRHQW